MSIVIMFSLTGHSTLYILGHKLDAIAQRLSRLQSVIKNSNMCYLPLVFENMNLCNSEPYHC